MSSPAGAPSHFLFRWMTSSSRAGVILNGSPEEVCSVRSSCSSQSINVSSDDSFSTQFAPLPMSRSSSCTSVDSVCPSQSSSVPVYTPPASQVLVGSPAAGKHQDLIHRLQQLKQLQQHMQEKLQSHQQEELYRIQNEQTTPLGMMPTAPVYNNIKQPSLRNTEQPRTNSSKTRPKVSPVVLVLPQPEKVERAQDVSIWNQESSVDQPSSGHHSDDYDHEASRHSDGKNTFHNNSETKSHDRPISLGGSVRTFEEMLEEQLRLENEKLSKISVVPSDTQKMKRPFLRRGEGLFRFTTGKTTGSFRDKQTSSDNKPTPRIDISAFTVHSSKSKRTSTKCTSATNAVTQRKTAVLNRNNVSQKTSVPVTKFTAKVNGHVRVERQNKCSGLVQHQSTNDNNPKGETVSSDIMVDVSKGTRQFYSMKEQSAQITENSFEVWLKERGEHWDKDQHREDVELGEFELLEKAADDFSFSSNSSFIKSLLRRDGRRLSSTPVKSPPKASFPPSYSDDLPGIKQAPSPSVPRVDSIAVMESANTQPDEALTECSVQDHVEESDSSLRSSTMFPPSVITSNLQQHFTSRVSAPPYDRRSYQHGGGSPEEQVESFRDSTLVDTNGQVEFDDDETWNEFENSTSSPAKMDVQPERVLKRKIAVSKGAERDGCSNSSLDVEPGPSPTCQLVERLFPALKPKQRPPPAEMPQAEEPSEQGAGDENTKSTLLRERLVELETEIQRFRKENAAFCRLKQENQEIQHNLRRERAEFQQNMADELAKWEEFKREETKKLQREKKLFEKHAAAVRERPDKQERDEIQSLKQQLNTLQEDVRKRESRWSSTQSRLRQQIDGLNAENVTLRDQIRTLEKLRLTAWKNAACDREQQRGRSGVSSNSRNIKTTIWKSSTSIKNSPPKTSVRTAVQNPLKCPASSISSSTDWQKSACPVAPSLHSEEVDIPRNMAAKSELVQEEIMPMEGKMEKMCPNGGRITIFPNGTKKQVSADGLCVTITFFNGDIKQIMPDQRVIYYYAETQTTHTTYPDGMEVLQFPNNQTEKHFTDGHKEILFPDQTVKNLYPDGREESVLLDGTIIQQNPDGTKQIQFITGQRELHTAEFKRREYPDGTLKTVYSDGRQETHYPNGRIRLKNPEGRVIMDTEA